jgi:hypothetical protein
MNPDAHLGHLPHPGMTCEEWDFEMGDGPAPLTVEERRAEVEKLEREVWGGYES